MSSRTIASYPEFTRLLKRYWGADLTSIDPDNPDPAKLYHAMAEQAALIQQLVEELASFMGKIQEPSLYAPLSITVDGTSQGDSSSGGVPSGDCGEGWAALNVINYGSDYDADTMTISGGHAAIFDGVVSATAICTRHVAITDDDGVPIAELGQATLITFQLTSGFSSPATVLAYYNGTNPGTTATVKDPNGIFPSVTATAKGRAVYDPVGDQYIAVECWETSGSANLTQGCGIALSVSGSTTNIAFDAATVADNGLATSGTCGLMVCLATGLKFNANNCITLDIGSGVNLNSNLSICLASGLAFDDVGCIKLDAQSGVNIDSGLSVCLSSGLQFDAAGCISANLGSGVGYNPSGDIVINYGSGITYNNDGDIIINLGSGTTYNGGGGLSVSYGSGITYNGGGDITLNLGVGLHFTAGGALESDCLVKVDSSDSCDYLENQLGPTGTKVGSDLQVKFYNDGGLEKAFVRITDAQTSVTVVTSFRTTADAIEYKTRDITVFDFTTQSDWQTLIDLTVC